MKKKLKLVGLGIVGVVALLITAVIVKFYVLSPKSRPAPVVSAPTNGEAVARGQYLVNHVTGCLGCHSPIQEDKPGDPPVESMLGAGRDFGDFGPKVPFHLRGSNITPDKDTGVGSWTDGELMRAIREGVSKDGSLLFPQMPYLTYRQTLSDGEVLDIIAYLRTLKPIKNKVERTSINFPVSMFIRGVPAPLEKSPPPPPSPSDRLARGRWLLDVCSCKDCHDSVNERMEKIPGKTLAGGFKFPLPGRGFAIAPNITSDKATGIGAYTDEDLRRVLSEGRGKDGHVLYVMPWYWYKGMTGEDRDALIAALREVPAVAQVNERSQVK